MNNKLSIPKRVRVGFQERSDTYTGKLAYVISLGKTGVRKENPRSWEGWRDKNIPVEEFENEPIEGFVLNRDVGGTQRGYHDWNARREKIRVYDPRDFEFEITVENVLLILQECSSIKGKGLEGEFVLAWSGSSIVLLPVGCKEYNEALELSDLSEKKVGKAEIQEGCTYITKDKKEVMYMGRFAWFSNRYRGYRLGNCEKGEKRHIFLLMDKACKKETREDIDYLLEKGFTKIAQKISDGPIPQFADEYEKLMASTMVSIPSQIVLKETLLDLDRRWGYQTAFIEDDSKIYSGQVSVHSDNKGWGYSYHSVASPKDRTYDINCDKVVSVKDGGVVYANGEYRKQKVTYDEVKALVRDGFVKCENGAEYKL